LLEVADFSQNPRVLWGFFVSTPSSDGSSKLPSDDPNCTPRRQTVGKLSVTHPQGNWETSRPLRRDQAVDGSSSRQGPRRNLVEPVSQDDGKLEVWPHRFR